MIILHPGCSIDRQCYDIIRSPFWHLPFVAFLKGHLFHDGHTVKFTWYKSCYYKLQARLSRCAISVFISPALSCMQTEQAMREERERGWTNVDVLRMERFRGEFTFSAVCTKRQTVNSVRVLAGLEAFYTSAEEFLTLFGPVGGLEVAFVNWLNWKRILRDGWKDGWADGGGWLAENLFLSKRDVR